MSQIEIEQEFWRGYHACQAKVMEDAPHRKTGEAGLKSVALETSSAKILAYPRPVSECLPQWKVGA